MKTTPELRLPPTLPCSHRALKPALKAALLAGGIVQKGFGKVSSIQEKTAGQLVTEVDLEADRLLVEQLRSFDPSIPIVSEESFSGEVSLSDDLWLVDPIDGTASFVFQSQPEIPAVMIALQEEKMVTLSIVLFPLTGECFVAVKDQGVYDQDGRKLTMKPRTERLSSALVALNHEHEIAKESLGFQTLSTALRTSDACRMIIVPMPHSTLALRMVTDESPVSVLVHDNSVATGKQGPWDVAPMSLMVEEAGGCFWNASGKPYDLREPSMIIVARSEALAVQTLQHLEKKS